MRASGWRVYGKFLRACAAAAASRSPHKRISSQCEKGFENNNNKQTESHKKRHPYIYSCWNAEMLLYVDCSSMETTKQSRSRSRSSFLLPPRSPGRCGGYGEYCSRAQPRPSLTPVLPNLPAGDGRAKTLTTRSRTPRSPPASGSDSAPAPPTLFC